MEVMLTTTDIHLTIGDGIHTPMNMHILTPTFHIHAEELAVTTTDVHLVRIILGFTTTLGIVLTSITLCLPVQP